MTDTYVLRLAGHHLYLNGIEDKLSLNFTENELLALNFTLEQANKLSLFLEAETIHSFVVENLDD